MKLVCDRYLSSVL